MRTNLIGRFDDTSDTPTFDPGLNVPCVVCAKQLSRPMKSISLMAEGGSSSYFFRVHKECWENLDDREQWLIESSIIDSVKEAK